MSTVTYFSQPAIHKTRGAIPLAGTSHVYQVNRLLWPGEVESYLKLLFMGHTLHVCCGKSKLGDVRVDLSEEDADHQADAAALPFPDLSFDTYLADVPYNGKFDWMHRVLNEAIRVTRKRLIWQGWFVPSNRFGYLRKAHAFRLTDVSIVPSLRGHEGELKVCLYDPEDGSYWIANETGEEEAFQLSTIAAWQPRSYFGRLQVVSVFDRVEPTPRHRQLRLPLFDEILDG